MYNPQLPPSLTISGVVRTATGEYCGIAGSEVETGLDLTVYPTQPSIMRWRLQPARVYGGLIEIDGSLFNNHLKSNYSLEEVALQPVVANFMKTRPGQVFSGLLSGTVTVNHRLGHRELMSGEGEILVEESRFLTIPIFTAIGRFLRLPIFSDLTFTSVKGPFDIKDEKVVTEEILFNSILLSMQAAGSVGFDKQLDLTVTIRFLETVSGVPLLGDALKIISNLAGTVLNLKITGDFQNPSVVPLGGIGKSGRELLKHLPGIENEK
jgi:hypothetical protein